MARYNDAVDTAFFHGDSVIRIEHTLDDELSLPGTAHTLQQPPVGPGTAGVPVKLCMLATEVGHIGLAVIQA
jgi:hypothetical protein